LSFNGQQLGQGREGARKALLDDPKLCDELIAKIKEAHAAKTA
jgi:recombination protein RecA